MSFISQVWTLTRKDLLLVARRNWFSTALRALILPLAITLVLGYVKVLTASNGGRGIGTPSPLLSLSDAFKVAGGTRNNLIWYRLVFTKRYTDCSCADDIVVIDHTNGADDVQRITQSLKQVFEDANKQVYLESDITAAQQRCPSSSRGASDCWGLVEFWSSPSQHPGSMWNYTLWYDGAIGSGGKVNSDRNPIQMYTLPLQHAIDSAIALADGASQLPDNIAQYSFTDSTNKQQEIADQSNYASLVYDVLAFAFFFGLCGITYHITGHIAKQREDGMLQLVDAMMPNSRWQSLVIRLASVHIAFDIIYVPGWVVMGIVAGTVAFPHTNTGYLVLLYLLTGLALTSYSILASTLFRRVQISAISSILAAIVFALVAQFAEGPYSSGAGLPGAISTAVLFAPSAFVYFLISIALFESQGKGLEITTIASGWSLPAIAFAGCLILQIVFYSVLGALLERWLHGHSSRSRHVRTTGEMGGKAIRLSGFTKEYNIAVKKRDRVCAVENLSLEVHAGSITVLLGSNGSGKSTTLKAIAGLESVSRGIIEVDGTGGIGICPQQNVLWDEMTVRENIACFQRLKNPKLPHVESAREVDRLIIGCDLELKKYARAKTLSGGQKRKLQLAMMLAGGSRVCCIDEASSGIDPLARRKVWDILLQERGQRTMLLTTHFLDESEVLSDHVAILSKGTLRAEGTVATLKSSLGGGYKVVLPNNAASRLSSEDVPASIARHEDYNNVVYEASDPAALTQFVSILTQSRIAQYNVHGPTIEDVFLRLADEMRTEAGTVEELKTFESRRDISDSRGLTNQHSYGAVSKPAVLQSGKGCGRLQQTWILFLKRLTVLKHNYMPYFGALFVPLVLAGMVTRFLLPPFDNPNGLECSSPTSSGYSGYGYENYIYRESEYFDRLFYGPPNAVTQQNLRTILPTGGFHLPKNYPVVPWNKTTSVSTFSELNSALRPIVSGDTSSWAAGGVFLADSGPTFVFEWSTVNTAISALSVLDQVLLNTTIAVSSSQLSTPYIPNDFQQGIIAVFMVLGFAIYPGFFSLYPTVERLQNVRAMQYSNGILSSSLWVAYALFDLIFVLLVSILATVIWLACIGSQVYGLGYLFVVFLLYGIAAAAYSYAISLFVPSQLSAMAATSLVQTVIAILFFVGYFVTITNSDPATYQSQLNTIYYTMALICPAVSLFRALLVSLNVYSLACAGTSRAAYPGGIEYFGAPILYLVVQALLLICFLMFWESGRSLEIFGIRLHHKPSDMTSDIEVVNTESHAEAAEDAIHMAHSNNGLRVHNISKSFGRNRAVEEATFGVLPSEKFALLGPNGAGKSTMISLIRGELHPDGARGGSAHGGIFIANDSLVQAPVAAKNHLGVCPQFDAVDRMTLSENLHFYARARGVPNRQSNIDELVSCLGLEDHVHKLVGKLSGGTKRKLSLAIALIANPSVLLLDEPSSGMDAAAKRALWQTLRGASADRCLLITTHSMEEADALCDRAGIMAKRMLALDSIPRLREKHGGRLYIHLVHCDAPYSSEAETARLWEWVQTNFESVQAEQKTFGGQLRFSVPVDGTGGEVTGRLFRVIERAKADIGIKDYSIGPTTLDQVFMNVVSRHGVLEENAGTGKQRRWWRSHSQH